MFESKVKLERTPGNMACFDIRVHGPELERLYNKSSMVNIRISAPISSKTLKQLATAHALMTALYLSGYASMPENCTPGQFKFLQKVAFGPCEWLEYHGQLIPNPKSMADYSKEELKDFIDSELSVIKQSGAESDKKIAQIIAGMEAEKNEAAKRT
jgi:hypothetical protein